MMSSQPIRFAAVGLNHNHIYGQTKMLLAAGAIGRVVQTTGFGPHRAHPASRPDWFFKRARYGGILTDIASHQIEQFLFFTGSGTATVVASQVGNFAHPEYP